MPEVSTTSTDFVFDIAVDEQQVIAVHSKSFALASKLLPREVRSDVCKLYAWCRWCDNAVDEAPSHEVAKQRLEVLRNDIEAIYDRKQPKLAASRWFADLAERYDLPKHLPLDLLLGMESDLDFQPIESQQDLERYCYRVAGVVGLMMCRLLGVTDIAAHDNANRLGMAMQMTNIARDIAEDWDRGRCYLPKTWTQLDPSKDIRPSNATLRPHLQRLLKLAETNYRIGYQGYAALPANTRLAIRVSAAVYRAIGTEIINQDFKVMNRRHYVTWPRKLLLVGQQLIAETADRIRTLFTNARHRSHSLNLFSLNKNHSIPFWRNTMKSQFHYLAIFGLSMTLIMATVLFAMMGINPKLDSYAASPWIYSAASAVTAAGLWFWAQSIGKQLDAATVSKD